MSERQAPYITGNLEMDKQEPSDLHEIRDEAPHNHFTSIPNMVDDMHLSPYAFRLYCHFKRVTGEFGSCWQSTTTLATMCDMSMGMISKAKHELTETKPPLIRIERKLKEGGDWYHEVKIIDIWTVNNSTFSYSEGRSSHSENRPSCGESKKNTIKKNQVQDEQEKVLPSRKEESKTSKLMESTIQKIGSADVGWLIGSGASNEEIAAVNRGIALAKQATDCFERTLLYSPLPWDTNAKWTRFRKFVVEEYKKDPFCFKRFKEAREGTGKFTLPSNNKIYQDPDLLIAIWPSLKAPEEENPMYKRPSFLDEDESKYVPH